MMCTIDRDYYNKPGYDNKKRFISYWYQKDEILRLNPKNVLEIGIGNGFLSRYLKNMDIGVVTLDIQEELNPDIKASVTSIPLKDNEFELVACFETLEHLPYKYFSQAIKEIFRVSSEYAVLSLPDIEGYFRFDLKIPKIREIKILSTIKRIRKPKKIYEIQHHWEIGRCGYQLEKILSDITDSGFEVLRTYRVFEVPNYRFFILKKNYKNGLR